MKKYSVLAVLLVMAIFATTGLFAQQGGFTGPSAPAATSAQTTYQAVSVNQLGNLPTAKAYVTLTGSITQSVGRTNYTFRDTTGEVTIKISNNYWWNLTVGPSDRVQILVEVERKRNGRIEVEAKGFRKI